ncbi:ATP-binding protein [Wenjunlia tyrosinilytica]|uniref:LuxR family transcriptional regulator n=1 Tax=Wenjunlia tyrosinilytica TaxID=1544741 RepID=A0A918DZM0_9ACTN|nr:NB-ARC domain-containing protein [Wenjunlia tyrosinilytica]GGO90273.1 LuxR family transcriptional regulator [Wenjunlia tyrosinilytica]
MAAYAPFIRRNAPVGESAFVGRRREVSQAKRLLRGTRLLTLAGVAGVGKTRLALQVADDVSHAYPDGVPLVELAALEDEGLLPQTVAAALGLRDQAARPPEELLCDRLHGSRLLLVLDNCEHVLPGCAELAEHLLQAAPGVRILATSRQPLGVYGESVLTVPTLSVPDLKRARGTGSLDRYEAVRLFCERAAAVWPGFTLDAGNREAVVRLCGRLDGIPLAIELAAARLASLPLEEILDRLDERFELLTGAGTTTLTRHETLRASIDWSYDLCSPGEQALWARVSVFAGGCDLDAVEAVCADGDIAGEDVLELVAGLVDKSILLREEQGGRVRYRLLDTIRQYGRERLEATGDRTAFQRRHRDRYRQIVDQAEAEWMSPRQEEWLGWLQIEHANIRTALDFCATEPGEARTGLAMAAALWPHWLCGGSLSEGRHWLEQALALAPEAGIARANALWVDCWLALLQGDSDSATRLIEQCRRLALELGHPPTLLRVTQYRGALALYQGDFDSAIGLLQEAVEGYRAANDRNAMMAALYQLTMACALRGDPRAAAIGEECLTLCEGAQAHWSRSYALWALGLHVWRQGEPRHAAELLRDALRTRLAMHDGWGTALCLEVLAWTAASDDQGKRGAELLGAAEEMWGSIGISPSGFRHLAPGHKETVARLEADLGGRAFASAFRRGAKLPLDAVGSYALQ